MIITNPSQVARLRKAGFLPRRKGNMKRALIRFGRIIIAAVLAATIGAAIQNVGELPISDQGTVCLLTAALVALDKFLRDRGVY